MKKVDIQRIPDLAEAVKMKILKILELRLTLTLTALIKTLQGQVEIKIQEMENIPLRSLSRYPGMLSAKKHSLKSLPLLSAILRLILPFPS